MPRPPQNRLKSGRERPEIQALRRGVAAWNAWCLARAVGPDFSGVDFGDRALGLFRGGADDPFDGFIVHAVMANALFSHARLSAMCIADSDFTGARFEAADLHASRLVRVCLRGADFRYADLTGAEFRDVDLEGARFEGALINGASVDGQSLEDYLHSTEIL